MPSPIAHTITGYVIFRFFPLDKHSVAWSKSWLVYVIYCMFIATLPDFDFIPQLLAGKKYHHGFTHSLSFTFIVSAVVGLLCILFNRKIFIRLSLLTFMIYGSHLLLDFFTDGGKGILLLWPFTDDFFISSVSFFPAVKHSKGLFHSSHALFISFELGYSALFLGGIWLWKRRQDKFIKDI